MKPEETPVEKQFPKPAGVKTFSGFGADDSDLARGFLQPKISEDPKYDKINYADRYTMPRRVDEDENNPSALGKDYAFRQKELRSRGFFTRPKNPTDR